MASTRDRVLEGRRKLPAMPTIRGCAMEDPFWCDGGKASFPMRAGSFGRPPAVSWKIREVLPVNPLCQFECSFKRTEKKDFLFSGLTRDSGYRSQVAYVVPIESTKSLGPKVMDRR